MSAGLRRGVSMGVCEMHTLALDPAAALAAAEAHLARLLERREQAQEHGYPGPSPKDISAAKKRLKAAEAAARGRRQ